MSVLKIRDKNGNFIDIPAIRGGEGKSAYEHALEGGFVGTEEEFNKAVAELSPSVTPEIEILLNKKVDKTDLGTVATEDIVPIEKGGTGASTTDGALENLGGLSNKGGNVDGILMANEIRQKPSHYHMPVEIGQYIDFHKQGSTNDYDVRLHITDGVLKEAIKGVGDFEIYGGNNKPTGMYNGTGESQTIDDKHAVGNAVIVYSSTGDYCGIIMPGGAIVLKKNDAEGNFRFIQTARFENGAIVLSGDSWVNIHGQNYTYYVI